MKNLECQITNIYTDDLIHGPNLENLEYNSLTGYESLKVLKKCNNYFLHNFTVTHGKWPSWKIATTGY